ncbi:penicillin-binding transpeptidase domain-containing protein [Luteolibacter flavescens]|uniref:Beta-lactamase n=1 Tax=Luteolibacter flavescens TaxID=1859460 RepID=A0ABT3FJS4_9BACT|nr:penicillin-binding transpeptidase domain-containing protein [Luteolibacter flavescens]MCW1883786.1 penicillin-binding transpeptidase domain-containing protein [Luteolibacter flavescens]
MEPRYRLRVYLLTALVLAGFGVLLSRLYEFQIDKREFYRNQVPGNRQITVREPGIRGTIKDRNGVELARNKRQYEISFNLEEIHEAYRLQREKDPKLDTIKNDNGIPRPKEITDIVEIVKERVIKPLKDLGLARDFNATKLRTHYKTHGGLVPFVYTRDITYEEFAKFAEHSLDIPGVYLNVRPLREYPYKALSSHTLGYLRQWSTGEIPEDARRQYGYQYVGDDKGVAGVEATLDDILRGPEGWKQVVKSEKGKILGETDAVDPGIGADVILTIDAEVQYLLSNILRRAGTASGVVMDVETGEILAMASVPDYDPNDFIPSISMEKNAEYEQAKIKPLIDRSISRFPPGSTFKIPTALVGATKGLATRSYNCSGYLSYGNAKVGCWIAQKGGSHGGLGLSKAIQQSCNPYFMQLAGSIGTKGMADGFSMLGLGEKTGIPLPNESPGLVTGSRAWQRARPNLKVTPIDIGFLSIGQGNALATPLQLCAVTACVANGGRYYHPRLVKSAVAHRGDQIQEIIKDEPRLKVDLLKEGVKPSDLNLIREGMRMAVNVPGGTAGRAKIPGYEVAAKTGTAQVSKVLDIHNAWTIAFAPYDKPKYAVCLLVENGKSGGAVCGPLAHLLFRGLMARDEGMKLPLHPLDPVIGNMDAIKEIALPDDVLAAIDVSQDDGETGNEGTEAAAAAGISTEPLPDSQVVTPKPTITPEADADGTVTQPEGRER